jgi:glucose-6-phosphate 1-dehydrogenase
MIARLALFGASGDLAARYLLPALAALHDAGRLPEGFEVVGAARQDWDDEAFRRHAAAALARHAPSASSGAREAVVRALRYRRVELERPAEVAGVLGDEPVAAYLALPPDLFPAAVRSIADAGLPAGGRIVLEKPFGASLDAAVALNRLLAEAVAADAVYRVDHALGLATVRNLLALRLANPVLDAVWRGDHVERVELLWEETLALEGRADYFDEAGALRDVVQNHVLEALAVVALEPPEDPAGVPAARLAVLRALRPPGADDAAARTRRARYTAGRLAAGSGRRAPAYADEPGVDPARGTETFAEVVLELASERWRGTTFVLRAGKALARRRKLALLRFRGGGELRVGLDGPNDVALRLGGGAPGAPEPVTLVAPPPAGALPAYGRVLLDVLSGRSELAVGAEEAEQAWRVVTPVLEAWSAGLVPLEEYAAGSAGPPPR